MFTYESITLEEAYDNLISNISLENIYAFLKACWLVWDEQTFSATTLERLVYAEGDQQEVYNRLERQIIKTVANCIFSRSIQLESSLGKIDCRLFAVELSSGSNVIYDSISTMKIINKAIDGFNVFMFVTTEGINFGCSSLTSHNTSEDCVLSYAITQNTNWEQLADVFLYRNDSRNIYEYYYELLNIFDSIKYCQDETDDDINDWRMINYEEFYDSDSLEEASDYNFEDYLSRDSGQQVDPQQAKNIYQFEQEILSCMFELSEIKKKHINPLEMLFEAEEALLLSDSDTSDKHSSSLFESTEEALNFDLLDDPIALMKKLKKDRGI